MDQSHRLGAFITRDGADFCVFCDKPETVTLIIDGASPVAMERQGDFRVAHVRGVRHGARYGFKLGESGPYPDPASRSQPDGPHALSEIADGTTFDWHDQDWRGVRLHGAVIYELHIGSFTQEGTFTAAMGRLPHLKALGVTVIEIMPVATFPGAFGWGYDGVQLFAPYAPYGSSDDLRRLVDEAHGLGIGVIHDVVYNHLGPDGNYTACFSDRYISHRYENEWGDALDFEARDAPMRQYMIENCLMWIEDFHFDGLRLDATQNLCDASEEHVMAEAVRLCRAATSRDLVFIGENEPQDVRLITRDGLDALWNDDFHHSVHVAARGRNPAYFEDHQGRAQEFVSAAKHGFLFQGQIYCHQGKRRGSPTGAIEPFRFVNFLENHDQIANTGFGLRLCALIAPARLRALAGLLLLMPGTPMLFQGEEFGATSPFFYFADHADELAEGVARGRDDFLSQFAHLATPAACARFIQPHDPKSFERSKLDWSEAERHGATLQMYRDLISLRRAEAACFAQSEGRFDGSVLNEHAFVLRWFQPDGDDRMLLVNLGADLHARAFPDPLIAPPLGRRWSIVWSSEDPAYGGEGVVEVETAAGWFLTGDSATFLSAAQ